MKSNCITNYFIIDTMQIVTTKEETQDEKKTYILAGCRQSNCDYIYFVEKSFTGIIGGGCL